MSRAAMPVLDDDVPLNGISATERLASRLSSVSRTGDVICLSGELGSGKTTFARFFIRSRAARQGIEFTEVPSPTFTLVQTYEMPDGNIWHFDLFRLENSNETVELGLEDALLDGICLIEWPDRLPRIPLSPRLDMAFSFANHDDERRVRIVGDDAWYERTSGLFGHE